MQDEERNDESGMREGSCHCQGVRFQVQTDLGQVMRCNCSICARSGILMTFAPGEQFRIVAGEELLTNYQFAKHTIHHTFCRVCGIKPFGRGSSDGQELVMINVGCLHGVDVRDLADATIFDGRSL